MRAPVGRSACPGVTRTIAFALWLAAHAGHGAYGADPYSCSQFEADERTMAGEKLEPLSLHLEAGAAIEHPDPQEHDFLVAPTTAAGVNTFAPGLRVTASWCVDDMRFAFDSSFVTPEIAVELRALAALVKKFPKHPLSVFAHADPVGNDVYNKDLSGRRAKAIYALLTRDVSLWDELFDHPLGHDDWRKNTLPIMARTVAKPPQPRKDGGGDEPPTPDPEPEIEDTGDPGAGCPLHTQTRLPTGPDDDLDEDSQDTAAPESKPDPEQRAKKGAHDKLTRHQLFREYMDRLCGPDLELEKDDFLGKGADSGHKADFQGCGEFNPVLLFTKDEVKEFSKPENKAERDEQNAPNRRVLVFIFQENTRIDPARWPCPRVKEGVGGCKKRFFSDGEKRRTSTEVRREYPDKRDTFACRFYDRLARESPCEFLPLPLRVRLYDTRGRFIPNAAWKLELSGQDTREGVTTPLGFLTVRRAPGLTAGTIQWGPSVEEEEDPVLAFQDAIFLDLKGDPATQAQRRLVNLGFGGGLTLPQSVSGFQSVYADEFGLVVTGLLDPLTQRAIHQVHDTMADKLREKA